MWLQYAEDEFGTNLDQCSGVGQFRYKDFMFGRSKSPGMVIRRNAFDEGPGNVGVVEYAVRKFLRSCERHLDVNKAAPAAPNLFEARDGIFDLLRSCHERCCLPERGLVATFIQTYTSSHISRFTDANDSCQCLTRTRPYWGANQKIDAVGMLPQS
jgi:hypothetical protein